MLIYVSHATQFDYKNELYEILKLSPKFKEHHFILPHEFADKAKHSYDDIKRSDVFLADVSYPSTGQGIEIAWADSLNKKIVCIHKKNSHYSSSLDLLNCEFHPYSDEKTLLTILGNVICR